MHLSDHSLRQMDDAYVRSLEWEALCRLSVRLLADLKEARDRLNQGPENSSRPPSSRAPWECKSGGQEPDEDPEGGDREPEAAAQPAEAQAEEAPSDHPNERPRSARSGSLWARRSGLII